MLNKKLAEMNENGTLPIFKDYLANIEANPKQVKSLSDFEDDGWYEVTDVDGFEKYLVYHYADGKKISVRYIFGKTPKIQEANPKGFFGEIADVISVFAYDSTLAVSKLNTEEGSAVKIIGLDTDGNLVEDDIPEGIVVDDELNTESNNAIANAPVATALNEKANTNDLLDGALIPNKALQAKSIEAVSTESGAVQDTPFIYQGTGTANGTSIADTSPVGKHLEKQGNSVVVNQLAKELNTTNWSVTRATLSVSNSVGTVTATAENSFRIAQPLSNVNGHKVLISLSVKSSSLTQLNIYGEGVVSSKNLNNVSSTFKRYSVIIEFASTGYTELWIRYNSTAQIGDSFDVKDDISIIDLTQWFGNNIPQDLLDHPENFFRYYNGSLAYNAGSMENGTGRYLTCGGRNVWDEEWELGDIDANGNTASSSTRFRAKNFIQTIPATTYRLYSGSSSYDGIRVYFYDRDKQFISNSGYIASGNVFITPSNCVYAKIAVYSGTTYNNDITVSLYYTTGDSYDQYFPYEEPKVYDTGSEVLRSAGSVRDVKAPDGTITRNVGVVDLGTLDWTFLTSYDRFVSSVLSGIANEGASVAFNGLNSKYAIVSQNELSTNQPDKSIALATTGALIITDSAYTDADSFKAAMSGVYLYYELAEPTTEQGTPFAENIEINDYGTMGWDSEVPQGCKIFYPADYALFVDSVGQRPDINWDMNQVVSHDELDDETDALEAKDTQLLNAVGGTLRQLLAVSKSIDFANTAFVDLGDLDWTLSGDANRFYARLDGIKITTDNEVYNAICSGYSIVSRNNIMNSNNTISLSKVSVSTEGYVNVHDDTGYTDATAFKTAMKGVLLAYEKASE